MMLAGFVSQGQNILTESFDGTTFPPTGWTRSTTTGLVWSRVTAGTFPSQSPHSGAGEANVNSWSVSTGNTDLVTPSLNFNYASGVVTVSFWMYRDNGFSTTADKIDVYVNTTATSTGGTLMGTVNRAIGLSPTVSATGWYQYAFNVPATFNSTTNYIIFKGTSQWGNDMFIDDVSVDHLVPCTGTITGGTASASPTPVCANIAFALTATSYTVGSGMSYQWQSSPAGANTWTNITGATTPIYTVTAGITTATDYRFVATCTNTSTSGTSNTVAQTLNSPTNCYCNSAASSNVDDDIGQVVVGSFSNPTTTPSALTSNSSSTGTYTNYTSLGPIRMIAGAATTFQATQINSGGYYTCYLKVFIDLNGNGSFTDPGETVFSQAGLGSPASPSYSGTITIPSSTTPITTRMRVTLQESGSATSVTPCNTYTWGETEDYTVQILSSTPPPPRVVNNSPVCPGSTFTITATDTGGYPNPTFKLVSGPAGPSYPITNTTGIFPITNATAGSAGVYTVTETSGGFESGATPTTVTMYPAANLVVGTIVPTSTCTAADGSFQLTGALPNTQYTLKYNNGATVIGPKTITTSATGTYTEGGLIAATYTNVQLTNVGSGGCLSNAITITVPPPTAPPTPIVTYPQPLCPNTTLQLTVTNPAVNGTYVWTSTPTTLTAAPFTSSGTTASRPNMTSAQNGSYCATVTVNGCVSAPGCVNVTVNSKDPIPCVVSPISYCQNEISLPLTTCSGANLSYYGPYNNGTIPNPCGTCPDSSRIARASITPRTDLAGNWVYGVVQNVTCPSDTAKIIVIIKPKPAKPTVPGNGFDYCQFAPSTPLSASGTSIRWFNTPTGGVGSATPPSPSTLVAGTYFYYVSQTVNGCESDRAVIAVNVKPKPAPPKVTSPLNLCQGDPVGPLTAIGQNLLWYTSPVSGVGVTVAPIPNTGYEDSFKYWVTQTVSGCESDRALIAAYVNYKPNGVIAAASQWVCQDANDTFYYYGNGRPDAQYVWSSPYPQTTAISGRDTRGPFVVHFDSAGTAVIRLQINNKGCISTLIAAPITVRHLPVIDYGLKRDVCVDELVNISLNATEPNISDYMFDFGSTDTTMVYSAPPGGPFGIRYHTAGDYIVGATATLNMCTSKPLEKRITVHALPDAKISTTPSDRDLSNVCASDTLILSVQAVKEGATYTWTPRAYFQSKEDTLNYIVRAVVNQSGPVKVNIKTAYGCEGSDSVIIKTKPCCGVFFPTAFAPEGNVDKNKTFKPITIGFHSINNFRIVNRWGQTVYETKNERAGWDGTFNGVKQDMGVYYYYISYKCEGKNVEEHGEVTLMR